MKGPDRGSRSAASPGGWRILVAGTGGQGVVLAARLLTDFFVGRGHRVVSGQLHGMAQRGGAVQSFVKIDAGIGPALRRGGADFVLGLEPVETVRALPSIGAETVVLMNTAAVVPFVLAQQTVLEGTTARVPEVAVLEAHLEAVTPHVFTLDATARAREAGSARALNVVMLGALLGSGRLPGPPEAFRATLRRGVAPPLAAINDRAFSSGVAFGRELQRIEKTR